MEHLRVVQLYVPVCVLFVIKYRKRQRVWLRNERALKRSRERSRLSTSTGRKRRGQVAAVYYPAYSSTIHNFCYSLVLSLFCVRGFVELVGLRVRTSNQS